MLFRSDFFLISHKNQTPCSFKKYLNLKVFKFTTIIFLILKCIKNNSDSLKQQKIVITGGPGTGKSTIIDQLIRLKFTCMPEISRSVIKQGQKEGIDQLFLSEPLLFSEKLLEGRIQQYHEAGRQKTSYVFFDRGIPDVHGYMDYLGTDYPKDYHEKSNEFRYTHIFMMPPWKKIHKVDNERYESFEQSMSIFQFLIEAYEKLDYKIITVPEGSVEQRVDFILNSL